MSQRHSKITRETVQEAPKKIPSILLKYTRLTYKVFGFFALFLGFLSSVVSFSAKVVVSPEKQIDKNNPFSTPFSVINAGFLEIYDVEIGVTPYEIITNNNIKIKNYPGEIAEIYIPQNIASTLGPGEGYTNFLAFYPPPSKNHPIENINSADIGVVVNFRPKWSLWPKKLFFRFKTIKDSDGILNWYRQPVNP